MSGEISLLIKGNASQLKTELTSSGAAVKEFGEQSSKYLQKGELSAKQMAFATRGLPAQFTDIAVSLQAGQNPMTVFLQQGGQLKDMFGGIGPATKAMGGYLMGLINPYTVAAAAAAALGYAWYKGAAEAGEYNKALILSGNTAGATALQMQEQARAIAASSGASTGAASDAVAQFVRQGDVAAEKIQGFAATAVSMQQLAGVAVSETVKQFSELGKDPVTASLKLNETTGYLTTSVYEQIKALMDQGKTLEAGALAQQAYGDAMNSRIPQLKANLGDIEKAWGGVASAAKGAWDWMLNIGRDVDPTTAIKQSIKTMEATIADNAKNMAYNPGLYGAENRQLEVKLSMLKEGLAIARKAESSASTSAQQAALQNKQLEAAAGYDKLHDQYLSKALQKEKAIAQATELYRAKMQDPNAALPADVRVGIEKKFKETPDHVKKLKADPWLTDVSKSYTSAMDQLGRTQSAASARAEELSRSQAKLRDIMGAPEWAAYSRQQREQIIVAGALAQAEEDKARAIRLASDAARQEARVAQFFNRADQAATGRNVQAVEQIAREGKTPQEREAEVHAERLAELVVFNASRLEGEAGANLLIELENQRHIDAMKAMQTGYDMQALSMMSRTADQIYNILKQSGKEQSALGKAVFLASKTIAVAQIIMNTEVAASAAIKDGAMFSIFGIPTGIALATMIRGMGYASAGMTAGLAIAEASARNGYDIPSGVNPMTQLHEEEMVLPRTIANPLREMVKGGGAATGGGGAITIINQMRSPIGRVTEQTGANGERALLIEEAAATAVGMVNAAFNDPNSKTSRSVSRNFSLQRSR